MANYTAENILAQWDEQAAGFTFPMLDNGYVYLAATRLTAYRDEDRWAVVIEVLGAGIREGGASNALYRFGNCFGADDALGLGGPSAFFYPLEAASDAEDQWDVSPPQGYARVRGASVRYEVRPETLEAREIPLTQAPDITCVELLRSLLPEHRDLLLATEDELRARVPADLPFFLRLDEWHHPDLVNDEKPSGNETFRMLAEALASGDASRYRPTLPPNTHWSHWPEGGTL